MRIPDLKSERTQELTQSLLSGVDQAAIPVSIQLGTTGSRRPSTAPAESSTTTMPLPSTDNTAAFLVSEKLAATGSKQSEQPAIAHAESLITDSPSPSVDSTKGVIAALTTSVPRSIMFAFFAVMLALFIASVASSYNQTKSAAIVARAYDEFSSSLIHTSTDDPHWTMYWVKYKQFALVNILNLTVNVSSYVPPFIADGYDPYLINLCRGEPYWKCDFTQYAGGGLLGYIYSLSGGNISIAPDVPSRNYVRLELTWSSLTPTITGGSVTLNYHIVLPDYLLDRSVFPSTSLFQLKFMVTPKVPIVLNQGTSAFDGTVTLQLPSGSWNMYPFDTYERLLVPACQVADPAARFGAWSIANPTSRNIAALTAISLSFILKIDHADLGVFSHSAAFVPASEVQPTFEQNSLPQVRTVIV
jgi:hypothetical protein